jgi:hypothetical protein
MSDPSAVEQLGAALKEQARLADLFDRSIGTSVEFASLARLEVANARVTSCQRSVDTFAEPRQE